MKWRNRQAGAVLGRALHLLGKVTLTLVSLLAILLFVMAFRLSRGPIQVPYLASVLATAVSGQGIDIHVGRAALAWGGYETGGTAPLYLQLGQITARNATGVTLGEVKQARLVFLPAALFGGRTPILVNSTDAHLAGTSAAVSLRAGIRFSLGFQLAVAELFITLGPGRIDGVAVSGGAVSLRITPKAVAVDDGSLNLAPQGGSAPVVTVSGAGARQGGSGWTGSLTIGMDRVQAGDLAAYWPVGLAAAARGWVTKNITAGEAAKGRLVLQLSAPANLSALALTGAGGGFAASGLTVGWLPHAMPITGLNGTLTVQGLDQLLIQAPSASLGGLHLSDGRMTISGLRAATQVSTVSVAADGRLQDAIAVLNAKPLMLLAQAPAGVAQATGLVSARVQANLPLRTRLSLAEVVLAVTARLSQVAVPLPLGGLTLTDGAFEVQASQTGARIGGDAQFEGEPAMLQAHAQFDAKPVLRGFTMRTVLGPAFLHKYGLDAASFLADPVAGVVPVSLELSPDAAGGQSVTVKADLTGARLGVPALFWSKPAGVAGSLGLAASTDPAGQLMVTAVSATAPGLDISGQEEGGALVLRTADIGQTVAHGTITPASGTPASGTPASGTPGSGGQPWRVVFAGPKLAVRAILNPPKGAAAEQAARATPGATPAAGPALGPAWRLALNFSTFRLAPAPAPVLHDFSLSGDGAGAAVLDADARALTAGATAVVLRIGPSGVPARRELHLGAPDGGELLRILGAYADLQGGALALDAQYGGAKPLAGTVRLSDFRLLQAPVIGKVLQGLTLYGVGEATSGPGLQFSRLVAPFRIASGMLTLDDARAYSASLGFTASGTIALLDGTAALDATVIPAYAINALPGKIPVIGKLFTAETGGGLFAVRVRVTGRLGDPQLSFNPFSALTPGVLRDVFGGGLQPPPR
jgi:hypothetical protein